MGEQIHNKLQLSRRRSLLLTLYVSLGLFYFSNNAIAAESLQAGVGSLATQIVGKTVHNKEITIAVSAFPHADNTCSKLSNYIVDELVFSLFDAGGGKVRIIERAQLDTIFQELKFSRSGAVDTKTAKQLGQLHGVDALVIGSITEIGDRLRVIARMISTDSGTVFSAARTSIPRTETLNDLSGDRNPELCGFGASVQPVTTQHEASNHSNNRTVTSAPSDDNNAVFESNRIQARLTTARHRPDVHTVAVVRLYNKSDKKIWVSYVERSRSMTTDGGDLLTRREMNGIRSCNSACKVRNLDDLQYFTLIEPGSTAQVLMSFDGAKGPKLINTALEIATFFEGEKRGQNVSVGFFDIPLK